MGDVYQAFQILMETINRHPENITALVNKMRQERIEDEKQIINSVNPHGNEMHTLRQMIKVIDIVIDYALKIQEQHNTN